MGNGIYNALSGAMTQAQVMDVVSNNLSNVSTPGYKAGRMAFEEVLARSLDGRPKKDAFVQTATVKTDWSQGAMRPTDRKLDVALEGPGYLSVNNGTQEAFIRGGRMRMRPDGLLTDPSGLPVLGRGGKPLRLPVDTDVSRLTIGRDGTLRVGAEAVGAFKITEFASPQNLTRQGDSRYLAPPAAGATPAQKTGVSQGFLESANFNMVRGISSMIVASRTYQAFHKVMSTFREVDTKVVNELGRTR